MSTREFMNLAGGEGSNRKHTCVVFGGYAGGGETLPYDKSGAAKFTEQVLALGLTVKDWKGDLGRSAQANAALTFIRESFDPKGKLIVYGYSAGGVNALDLTRELRAHARYFEGGKFHRDRPRLPGRSMNVRSAPSSSSESDDEVMIDLLITIDAYQPDMSELVFRVPANVVRFINIYQRWDQKVTGSRGRPLARVQSGVPLNGCNQDRTDWAEYKKLGRGLPNGGAHAYIDEDTHQAVFEKVEALIKGGPDAVDCKLR